MAKAPKSALSGGGGSVLYYEIANFQNGIDTRKDLMTAPAGTMRTLQNCHITPGGEIEKRSAFVSWFTTSVMPAGLLSMNGQLYCVYIGGGSSGVTPPPDNNHPGTVFVNNPSGVTLTRMMHWDIFEGHIFTTFLGTTSAGTGSYSFYDGVYISG